ncbi:MAG: cbb3-type cytochrome c oxidase subunit 3 [Gammaproteobacteria bacterium]
MGTILSIWTVAVFIVFIAIVIWVMSKKKEDFDEQANIPFNEDKQPGSIPASKEENNG